MFDSRKIDLEGDGILSADESRTIELRTLFRRVHCYHCEATEVYKYRVKEIRKLYPADPERATDPRLDSIPRYAQIPETVRCNQCGEVLGLYTECIF